MFYRPKDYLRSLLPVYYEEIQSGLDFWAEHGMDWEKGGLVVYLDQKGDWYFDEKQGWFTGRAMYSFAKGYNDIEKKQRWLDAALNLYDFMIAHQFVPNGEGKLYYNMDRDGNPCKAGQRAGAHWRSPEVGADLHVETFAIMGLSELYKATGRADVKATLEQLIILQRKIYCNPNYFYDRIDKTDDIPEKPPMGYLMSLLCSTQTVRQCVPEREEICTKWLQEYVDQAFRWYYDSERKMLYEREIESVGHSMEVAWFMLAEGLYTKNQELVDKCAEIVWSMYEVGWNKEHGGFPIAVNLVGNPGIITYQDMNIWWSMNEIENGLIYAYIGTGDEKFLTTYRKVHEYTFGHFPDRDHGEWFGYLHYDGTPATRNKGDNQKGPFHLYRSFYAIYELVDAYLANA